MSEPTQSLRRDVTEQLALLSSTHPTLLRLAEVVSLAPFVEPSLLRHARLRFLPREPMCLEAELWFSPLTASRGPRMMIFSDSAAQALRERLGADPDLARAARHLLIEMHGGQPPLVRLLEDLIWTSLTSAEGVERVLQLMAQHIRQGGDGGRNAAMWALRFMQPARAGSGSRAAVDVINTARDVLGLSTNDSTHDNDRETFPGGDSVIPVGVEYTDSGLEFSRPPTGPRRISVLGSAARVDLEVVSLAAPPSTSERVSLSRVSRASVLGEPAAASIQGTHGERYVVEPNPIPADQTDQPLWVARSLMASVKLSVPADLEQLQERLDELAAIGVSCLSVGLWRASPLAERPFALAPETALPGGLPAFIDFYDLLWTARALQMRVVLDVDMSACIGAPPLHVENSLRSWLDQDVDGLRLHDTSMESMSAHVQALQLVLDSYDDRVLGLVGDAIPRLVGVTPVLLTDASTPSDLARGIAAGAYDLLLEVLVPYVDVRPDSTIWSAGAAMSAGLSAGQTSLLLKMLLSLPGCLEAPLESLLSTVTSDGALRRAIAARSNQVALAFGSLELVGSVAAPIIALKRRHNHQEVLCVFNISDQPQRLTFPHALAAVDLVDLLDAHEVPTIWSEGHELTLSPYQARWLRNPAVPSRVNRALGSAR